MQNSNKVCGVRIEHPESPTSENALELYIQQAKNREKKNRSMLTTHEIALGVSYKETPNKKRDIHLWCYRTEALNKVEEWLNSLSVIENPNFRKFDNFEDLYKFVRDGNDSIEGIGPVEIYDVSLCLGERMTPSVVPHDKVYVHGKLRYSAQHYLEYIGNKQLNSLKDNVDIKLFEFDNIADSPYAARAIEEWLCCEYDAIMNLKK